MPAALQKPLSSSRPEMVAAHVPLALHDGVFVPARTVVAGRYGYGVRHRQPTNRKCDLKADRKDLPRRSSAKPHAFSFSDVASPTHSLRVIAV